MQKQYFITGIGTDVGKTIISAILTETFQADYWKPVQCGDLENTDKQKVKNLISNNQSQFHKETYLFTASMSPHAAAKLENIEIDISNINLPQTTNHLIIEGAGGLMVPLNNKEFVIDLIQRLNVPSILVSMNYLGSINHTLLSIEALQERNIPITGIIFNGEENKETERIISECTKLKILGKVGFEKEWNKEMVKKYAEQFRNIL
ncbi:MAG: dethiobiotin synthase [Fimbriimonadaceae bacterium]|nr:dethiobiotin synthase [Chitinophagales bacterium]